MSKYHWLLVGVAIGLLVLICFSGCTSSSFNKLNVGQVISLPNDECGYMNIYRTRQSQTRPAKKIEKRY